jgi:D-alanyl-D-alanine carboxypeptidase (penicillin-binding protein 5/6)
LDNSDDLGTHSTTAKDLALIMRYCILHSPKKESFLKITQTPKYTFSNLEGKRTYQCYNRNSFLTMMEGVISGKTGYTGKAGYCYVGALKSGERTFTVALLACGWPNHKTYKWSDTKTLMQYGMNHYKYRTYAQALDQWFADNEGRDVMAKVMGEGGCSSRLGETAYTALKLGTVPEGGMLLREDERLTVHFELPATLPAPVTEGSVVGEVIWQLHGTVQATAPVRCIDAVAKITPQWCIEQIVRRFLIAFSDQMR